MVARHDIMKKWFENILKSSVKILAIKKHRKTIISLLPKDIVRFLCIILIELEFQQLKTQNQARNLARSKHMDTYASTYKDYDNLYKTAPKCVCGSKYEFGFYICRCKLETY